MGRLKGTTHRLGREFGCDEAKVARICNHYTQTPFLGSARHTNAQIHDNENAPLAAGAIFWRGASDALQPCPSMTPNLLIRMSHKLTHTERQLAFHHIRGILVRLFVFKLLKNGSCSGLQS